MVSQSLYTIGYGSRTPEDFIALLKNYKIDYLIDVRSSPYSKFNPKFNQNELKFLLKKNNIKYAFMGDTLGGRPTDISCYDNEGKVDYLSIREKSFFINGISRLESASSQMLNVALMCSESNPCDCHRSKLIGRVLVTKNIVLNHIDERGRVKDQFTVINELNKGIPDSDLFGTSANSHTSRKKYL
jgi:uncharacterized protein (DUF488 family)